MGFYATDTRPAVEDLPPKNRVMGSRRSAATRARFAAPEPVDLHQETRDTSTKTVSGLVCWLSRDPIHERGGINLYTFVKNDPVDKIDPRGLACGVIVKRITADVTGRTDKYGHEWIEVGGGTSSYGWWPVDGVSIWDALFGVPGDVNRGRPQDPHNMDVSDITWETEIETRAWIFFSRKLEAGSKAGTPCKCASCGDILDCLDSFAGNYAGKWSIWRSCRTFSKQALSACCLEKGKKTVTTRTYTVP